MNELLKTLKDTVLIADGGMGTMVQELSPRPVECVEALNLGDPELVREIHRQFVAAGAVIIETNTFGAHRFALEKYRLESKVAEINRRAVEIARSVTRPGIFIAGSVGPFFPRDQYSQDDGVPYFRDEVIEQIKALDEAGVDFIMLETYPGVRVLLDVLDIVKEVSSLPVVASLSPSFQCTTFDGSMINDAFLRLVRGGADIVGLNCGHGIKAIECGLEQAAGLDVVISAMPNAGLPERVGGRLIYGVSEEYFAEKALAFVRYGARIIGGCCGITPVHIRAAADRLKSEKVIRRRNKGAGRITESSYETGFKEGAFLASIKKTRLPVICEIDPPSKLSTDRSIDAITRVWEAGANAISMAENPLATVKVSNLAFAAKVKELVRARIVLHLTGRDHNTLGLQSLMLGAHVLGIEALLCVTGDPSHHASGTSNVFDVDSLGLICMAAQLNRGNKAWGDDAGKETDFSLGAAFNPNMSDYSIQIKRLRKKIEVGARFVMTQPLFENAKIAEVTESIRQLGIKVFIGIFPLIALKTALYLHNEVPGITVPEEVRMLLAKKDDKDYQREAGIDFTKELISGVASKVDGLYLIAPHAQPELLESIVQFIRKLST